MEILLLALIAIVLLMALVIWITASLLGLIVTLAFAGLVGWLADRVVPGKLPYGWLGAIAAGLLGSWIGGILLGNFGPEIADIRLIPGFIGAVGLAFLAELVLPKENQGRSPR